MIVDLTEVTGPADREGEVVGVNPRSVVLVRRAANASNPDAQEFVTELTLDTGLKLRVLGAPSAVRQLLNLGGR